MDVKWFHLEKFKSSIETKCDLYYGPRSETAVLSTGQTTTEHGMSHVLEKPLTELKMEVHGSAIEPGFALSGAQCGTDWLALVLLGKSSVDVSYSEPLGQGNRPTHRWKLQKGEVYIL